VQSLQIVEVAARQISAAIEQPLQQRAMIAIERQEQGQDRVPAIRLTSDDQVAFELFAERAFQRFVGVVGRAPTLAEPRQQGIVIQDQHQAGQRLHHEVGRQLRDASGGPLLSGFQQDLQPGDEALGREGLALARPAGLEQIFVEGRDQLLSRSQGDQLARVFDS
jgi:hypothetical protein